MSPFKNTSNGIYFLYWFQEALATIQALFWHEYFSWEYFPGVFFEHSCIVEKSNQQCSTQREWLQRLTHCNGLALLSWHLCLTILSQRCYCPCFLSKTLMHIQKIRMMLLEGERKKQCRLLNLKENKIFLPFYFKWRWALIKKGCWVRRNVSFLISDGNKA